MKDFIINDNVNQDLFIFFTGMILGTIIMQSYNTKYKHIETIAPMNLPIIKKPSYIPVNTPKQKYDPIDEKYNQDLTFWQLYSQLSNVKPK